MDGVWQGGTESARRGQEGEMRGNTNREKGESGGPGKSGGSRDRCSEAEAEAKAVRRDRRQAGKGTGEANSELQNTQRCAGHLPGLLNTQWLDMPWTPDPGEAPGA